MTPTAPPVLPVPPVPARTRRRGRGPLAVLAAAVLVLTGAPAPATAGGGDPQGSAVRSGVARSHGCTLYANGGGFGALCGSGVRGRGRTWLARLEGNPFVRCRQDDVPPGVGTPPAPDGAGRWMLETCMQSFDLNRVDGGDPIPVTRLVWVPAGGGLGPVPPWMDWFWDSFATSYPQPLLRVGPTVRPRVNVPAYFWLDGDGTDPVTRQVFDGVQTLTMTARLRRLEIDPSGGGRISVGPVDCADPTVPYDPATGPFQQVSTCTFTFPRSSASLPGFGYPIRADAFWEVGWTDAAGTYRQLGTFPVTGYQLLVVQEVESVVRVSGD